MRKTPLKTVGIAGLGAIGSAVGRALQNGIDGFDWVAASEHKTDIGFDVPLMDFDALAAQCDLIIECLPAAAVPSLAERVFHHGKDMIVISSCALLMFPEILEQHKQSQSRIFIPSGALAGLDGVRALKELGIRESKIASTKPPRGFAGAPYVVENGVDLNAITTKTRLFSGNALEAAKGFPANVNVAATLSLAGIGPDRTMVEIWADPAARGNAHEITVSGEYSTITARIENMPDPANPKSSALAAQSIVATLRNMGGALAVL